MAEPKTNVQSLPEPGVAIFAQNISANATDLVMIGKPESTALEIRFADGQPFLHVESAAVTMSNRKRIIDAVSGKKICDIRSKAFSRNKSYYAVSPEASKGTGPLFEIVCKELKTGVLSDGGKYEMTMNFQNVATGSSGELCLKGDSFADLENAILCNGICCGLIDEKFRYSKGEWKLRVGAGLDPFLVAVFAVALDDKETEDGNARTARIANVQGPAGGVQPA